MRVRLHALEETRRTNRTQTEGEQSGNNPMPEVQEGVLAQEPEECQPGTHDAHDAQAPQEEAPFADYTNSGEISTTGEAGTGTA